ncbi:MAG TPA: hypothetical protein PKC67_02875 [Kiritimatiellia bacterium]|nr:hypothetical protein [Kiritimatiellia bacterium]HMP33270.1 hypothetical protein [Kiritimatiellia bacterium]
MKTKVEGTGQTRKDRTTNAQGTTPPAVLDLDALDLTTRRVVNYVVHRMPDAVKRQFIIAANVEAILDLAPGGETKPSGYACMNWEGRADHNIIDILSGYDCNRFEQPAPWQERAIRTILEAGPIT